MRKLIFLLSSVLFLSACSFDNAFKDDPDLISLSGLLQEQKSNDEYSGTHLLIDENKAVTALRSLSFNLSGQQYLNNKVQVVGFLNTEDKVFEVSGISVLEVLDESKTDADAEIYRNTDLGFEIRYYEDWKLEENGNVAFVSKDLDSVEIEQIVFESAEVLNPSDAAGFLKEYVKQVYPGVADFEKYLRKIGADNLDAVKLEEKVGDLHYLFYRNGLIYRISFVPSEKSMNSLDNALVFEEMVSSFRFTGFTVDTGVLDEELDVVVPLEKSDVEFTSFESLPYKFKASYPADWYYAGNSGSGDVLHHYSFSNEAVTEENILISLDVLSSSIPAGKSIGLGKNKGVKVESGEDVNVYLTVNGQNYRVTGPKEYEAIIMDMAGSILAIEEKDE